MHQPLPKSKKSPRTIPALGPKKETIDFILEYSRNVSENSKRRKAHLEVTFN